MTLKQPEKALYGYRKSADQDTPEAMKALSRIDTHGLLGQKVNTPLAREWAAKERRRMKKLAETESLSGPTESARVRRTPQPDTGVFLSGRPRKHAERSPRSSRWQWQDRHRPDAA